MSDFFGALVEGAFNLVGSGIDQKQMAVGRGQQMDLARDNIAFQNDLAKNGVRYRVEDAKAAGIHPLFALGMSPFNPSPVSVGGDGGTNFSEGFSRMGQNLSRAIDSTRTSDERVSARLQALGLERAELQNDLLRSQIARNNQQMGPPMPSSSPDPYGSRFLSSDQGPLITDEPLERHGFDPGNPSLEAGSIPDVGWTRTRTGWQPVQSKDAKERLEEDVIGNLLWSFRNRLVPWVHGKGPGAPPISLAREMGGVGWRFNRAKGEWQVVYDKNESGRDVYKFRLPSN